jgi:hypothetical protein
VVAGLATVLDLLSTTLEFEVIGAPLDEEPNNEASTQELSGASSIA